jgi:beta-N-acetylglucosaminidase
MNPNNFKNSDQGIYQFLKLSYMDGISADDLNNILKGKGILEGKGSVFIEAGRANNVNPIYLVSHALLETGNGTSKLANGIYVNQIHSEAGNVDGTASNVEGKTVYNMFGIGAYDSNANLWGSERAYNEGWFSVDSAIIGGAKFIGKSYINSSYKQDTIYKMRWNVNYVQHQYATDIAWANSQCYNIKKLVDQCNNSKIYFEIPVYN